MLGGLMRVSSCVLTTYAKTVNQPNQVNQIAMLDSEATIQHTQAMVCPISM